MYYVYYLYMSNGQIYTGSTKNLKNRMNEHNCSRVTTTSKYLPVNLIGYEAYSLKTDAQRREKYMKSTEGKMLFRQQYRDIMSQLRASSSAG